jgi:hypothetical protein
MRGFAGPGAGSSPAAAAERILVHADVHDEVIAIFAQVTEPAGDVDGGEPLDLALNRSLGAAHGADRQSEPARDDLVAGGRGAVAVVLGLEHPPLPGVKRGGELVRERALLLGLDLGGRILA